MSLLVGELPGLEDVDEMWSSFLLSVSVMQVSVSHAVAEQGVAGRTDFDGASARISEEKCPDFGCCVHHGFWKLQG